MKVYITFLSTADEDVKFLWPPSKPTRSWESGETQEGQDDSSSYEPSRSGIAVQLEERLQSLVLAGQLVVVSYRGFPGDHLSK